MDSVEAVAHKLLDDLQDCVEKLRRQRRVVNQIHVLYERLLLIHHASDETRDILEDLGTMLAMLREE